MESSIDSSKQMLSFSFDTEILSLFWGLLGKIQEHPQEIGSNFFPLQTSSTPQLLSVSTDASVPFFRFLVFPTKSEKSFYSYFQYSAVTTGILALVGISSYCTYTFLTKARGKLLEASDTDSKKVEVQIVPRNESNPLSDRKIEISRPVFLALPKLSQLKRYYRVTVGLVLLDEREEADERLDAAHLEPEYFGPAQCSNVNEYEEDVDEDGFMFPLEARIISPTDSAYTSEYESSMKPVHLRIP